MDNENGILFNCKKNEIIEFAEKWMEMEYNSKWDNPGTAKHHVFLLIDGS